MSSSQAGGRYNRPQQSTCPYPTDDARFRHQTSVEMPNHTDYLPLVRNGTNTSQGLGLAAPYPVYDDDDEIDIYGGNGGFFRSMSADELVRSRPRPLERRLPARSLPPLLVAGFVATQDFAVTNSGAHLSVDAPASNRDSVIANAGTPVPSGSHLSVDAPASNRDSVIANAGTPVPSAASALSLVPNVGTPNPRWSIPASDDAISLLPNVGTPMRRWSMSTIEDLRRSQNQFFTLPFVAVQTSEGSESDHSRGRVPTILSDMWSPTHGGLHRLPALPVPAPVERKDSKRVRVRRFMSALNPFRSKRAYGKCELKERKK